MNATDTRAPGVALLFAEGAEPAVGHTTWNQITKAGRYAGHRQGEFSFDDETHAQILATLAANGDGRVPVDYEHTSEVLPENTAQEGVPAVAWIVAAEMRGADLWGCFEWVSARAVEQVRARQYLFVSPAVNFNARDKVTGKPCGSPASRSPTTRSSTAWSRSPRATGPSPHRSPPRRCTSPRRSPLSQPPSPRGTRWMKHR